MRELKNFKCNEICFNDNDIPEYEIDYFNFLYYYKFKLRFKKFENKMSYSSFVISNNIYYMNISKENSNIDAYELQVNFINEYRDVRDVRFYGNLELCKSFLNKFLKVYDNNRLRKLKYKRIWN